MHKSEQLIRDYYKAFNDKKFDSMINLLAKDVVHDINQGSRDVGAEKFTSFMKDMDAYYDENLTEIIIMLNSDGTRAAAEFICNGVYKKAAPGLPPANGQKYKLPVGCFFEIKDNKIARVTNYYNMNEWLKMVK